MPYDPGVVDRSGEIRAEATRRAGETMRQGVANALEASRRQQEENRVYREKVAELELFVRINAEQLGLDTEEKVEEALAPKKREAVKDRYERLNTFVQMTLIARTIEAKAKRLSAPAPTGAKAPPRQRNTAAQSHFLPSIPSLGKHSIADNKGEGGIIVLDNGSVWEVDPLSRLDVVLWLPFEDVVVVRPAGATPPYSYLLVNADEGESVPARYVGQRQPGDR